MDMTHLKHSMECIRAEIAKLTDAHDAIARLCGGSPMASPSAAAGPVAAPVGKPKPAPATRPEGSQRVSKYFEPVGKALLDGPKTTGEIEKVVGAVQACFIGQLERYTHLFKRNGIGRGSTWELTEAGRREFAGKA